MVRTQKEAWLQGFLTITTFTTWTNFFKWDSKASMSGMRSSRCGRKWDSDNTLGNELERQERHGDPQEHGVIWPRIAEVSLVGALGCGGWLLQFIVEQATAGKQYDYIVLQASSSSISFYERYGFVRVGAIARYGAGPVETVRTVGYRHWCYSDERVEANFNPFKPVP